MTILNDNFNWWMLDSGTPDMDWVTKQIAVGGGVWGELTMAAVARAGITHILNMDGFDDTVVAKRHGITALWNPVADDLQPKSPEPLARGVRFARMALAHPNSKLLIHCAAGIHRAPMMTLAVLRSMGWGSESARRRIKRCRRQANFPGVYVNSVENYLREARP